MSEIGLVQYHDPNVPLTFIPWEQALGDKKLMFFMAGPYATEEEARQQCKILDEPCRECGGLVETDYMEPLSGHLSELNVCFRCHFWLEIMSEPEGIRVDGVHYIHYAQDTGFKGHGGRLFRIQMHNGIRLDSRNLWCQGPIPDRFRDRLYDNAEFLPEDHSKTEAGFLKAIFFEGPEG